MTINATKKVGLFLSVISVYGSVFGMGFELSKPKIVLSNDQRKAAAVLGPIIITGGVYLCGKYGLPSMPDFSSIPYEVKCGVATMLSMPVVHSLLARFTLEDKLKLYTTALEQFEKSKFNTEKNKEKNKEKINAILGIKDEAEAACALTDFINSEFGENPRIVAEKHLLDLKDVVEKGRKAFKRAINNTNEVNEKKENTTKLSDLGEKKEQLKTLLRLLRKPESHDKSQTTYDKNQRTNVKKERLTFASKIGTFVPMFIQPVSTLCMVLLQIILAKCGIQLQ